jgi:hypothetical protein
MPVSNWIGEEAVVKHRKKVPSRLSRKEIHQPAGGYSQCASAKAAHRGGGSVQRFIDGWATEPGVFTADPKTGWESDDGRP